MAKPISMTLPVGWVDKIIPIECPTAWEKRCVLRALGMIREVADKHECKCAFVIDLEKGEGSIQMRVQGRRRAVDALEIDLRTLVIADA